MVVPVNRLNLDEFDQHLFQISDTFYMYVSEYETSRKSGKSQLPDIVCVITGMY